MQTGASDGRLALFLPTLDDGGAERVMLQLAAAFSARGRTVDLVVGIPGGPLDSQVPPGPRLVDLGARRTALALPALVRYLRRERPAALLATLEHANVLAVGAAALARTGTRVVLREANVLLPGAGLDRRARILRRLMRAAYRRAGAIVAVSASVARSLAAELGVAPEKIRTIYNPIVTPAIADQAAAALDDPWFAPGAPPVILGVGRLAPQKDFPTLLKAFARVRAAREARLVILGEGPDRAALEALARELGVAADVKLPGYDHNPFRYFARATVFALSSIYEGLPGALIQAMACGCRVLSTDCPGGSREILQDGALGPLCPPADPEALAAALTRLLDDARRAPERPRYPLEPFSEAGAVSAYLETL
ncbi:MAG TPA: glycosyltransferase [Polyangia bacterium]|nr:glycosyltransferase [Polyangia bacterium]